jgi:hypothetical protein
MDWMEATRLKKVQERKSDVAEIKMIRWMWGVTCQDRIRNTP